LFSFTDPAPTELFTLSLHDALPIFIVRTEDGGTTWSKVRQSEFELGSVASAAPWDYTVIGRNKTPPYALGLLRSRDDGLSWVNRSEEHTSELQSLTNLVCRLLLEKK